jgi:fumarate reductase flavoprotein subunit
MDNVTVNSAVRCFDQQVEVLVVGAGACGLIASLRAHAQGAEVVVLERDSSPTGSTSLSSGFIPAGGTRFQRDIGVHDDNPTEFAKDIQSKSHDQSHPAHVALACENIAPALEWLADDFAIPWIVLDDFLYPGHRYHRMHAVPEKTGESLQARLLAAVHQQEIPIATDSRVTTLWVDEGKVNGVEISRPDGQTEAIGCKALILACNGYGGNREMVKRYIPEIASGLYFGHPGNTGDAVVWGNQLQAELAHLSGYQGHGSVAHPHGMLITWALMMEGGVQVNLRGERFSNEHGGYSEQAVNVLAQPEQIVWNIYDERIHQFAEGFPDYRQACEAGAIKCADRLDDLARQLDIPAGKLERTMDSVADYAANGQVDSFGRSFEKSLQPPWYAVKVTGALFHTQGGLVLDQHCRVRKSDGSVVENLYAGGGAACGVSGPEVSGYLSGNGLLTAVAFGFVAGDSVAKSFNNKR